MNKVKESISCCCTCFCFKKSSSQLENIEGATFVSLTRYMKHDADSHESELKNLIGRFACRCTKCVVYVFPCLY